jgi:hypothetical protein
MCGLCRCGEGGGIEQGFDTGNLRRRVVQGEAVEATAGIDVLATVRAPGG